jgi:hypothetical protein
VGAVLEMAGLPVAMHRDLAFSLAESAHRAWQGGLGSGADVAAAVHGGVLQYSRPGGGGAPVVRRIARALDGLSLVVFSSGTAAATTQQIRGVRAFAASAPDRYAALLAPIRAAADRFVESIVGTLGARPRETLAATRAAGDAMAALGDAAGVPIAPPSWRPRWAAPPSRRAPAAATWASRCSATATAARRPRWSSPRACAPSPTWVWRS